ncbi:MAG: FAD-dependent oxidoreductase, partial [Candidatus Dormiibacterota bacterium]
LERMSTFRERYGEDIGFRRAGYLMLFGSEEHERVLRRAVERQHACDVPTQVVTPEDAAELLPGLAIDDLRGAAFSAIDGYLDPRATTTAFGRAARRAGATIREGWEVAEVEVSAGRATAIRSATGTRLTFGTLVNAAGAWAPRLAAEWGGELPIRAMRAQAFIYDRLLREGRLTPLTIDYEQGLNLHSEGRGFLVGPTETTEFSDRPWTTPPELGWAGEIHRRLARRIPEMAEARFAHAWAGFLETTPDDNPVVGWTHLDNVYTMAGFSGHGMCLAPGLAPAAAAEITGAAADPDLAIYRLDRFERGTSQPESVWGGSKDYGFHGGPWRPSGGPAPA